MDRITLDEFPAIAAVVRGMVEKHLKDKAKEAQLHKDREVETREKPKEILGFRPSLDEDKDKKTDSCTNKGPSQDLDLEGFRPEQDHECKMTKKELISLVVAEMKANQTDNGDAEKDGSKGREIRRELLARLNQELIHEAEKTALLQKQLQETRQLVADFQERTKKANAELQFIQHMTWELQERIDKIDAARKKRAASK